MRRLPLWLALTAILSGPLPAQDAAPLSIIDWLSQSVDDATTLDQSSNEPPVAESAQAPRVIVSPLDSPSPDPVGLLSSEMTGLPDDLWARSDSATLEQLVAARAPLTLPALTGFRRILLLAEAEAPIGAGPQGDLFLARVDALLDQAALEQALALLQAAGPDDPTLFRRYFDVALLTGTEDRACQIMAARPAIAPTYPARIFCLARRGDWPAAALTLNTHRVLGDVSEAEDALLSRFLDPTLYEEDGPLPLPERVTPLIFRMHEAIGENLNTSPLPLAFAHADLRDTSGWKVQLEAAERLARHSAIPPNQLQALYTARRASASGGVWERVAAFQDFDTALRAKDPAALDQTLPIVWDAMKRTRAEVAFSTLYADEITEFSLGPEATEIAVQMGLLSEHYEEIAGSPLPMDPFLRGLARGDLSGLAPTDPKRRAIQEAFADRSPPAALQSLASEGKLGEALLRAIALCETGIAGDPAALRDALSFFRTVGLEDLARRVSMQSLLLDRSI